MSDAVDEIFSELKAQKTFPAFEGVRGTFRFDIQGHPGWVFRIDNGKGEIYEGKETADVVISTDPDTFLRIMKGEQNFLTAAMQGLVKFEGDYALAQKFHGSLAARLERLGIT
jgi:putative sterol carrier protein